MPSVLLFWTRAFGEAVEGAFSLMPEAEDAAPVAGLERGTVFPLDRCDEVGIPCVRPLRLRSCLLDDEE
jgi:hypothetical protein